MVTNNRFYIVVVCMLSLLGCNTTNENVLSENVLGDYLKLNEQLKSDEVIACAGSDKEDVNKVFVYYYPVTGSTSFRYYETSGIDVNPNDFSNYQRKKLPTEGVLGNKLSRFIRTTKGEAWGIVTFLTEGKIHKSNPIRLKHQTKPTIYHNNIVVNTMQQTAPKFQWEQSMYQEDAIYFQALVSEANNFISGTYTTERCFRYYDTSNVVLHINEETPPLLNTSNKHTMHILGVSEDNWVNVHAQKIF